MNSDVNFKTSFNLPNNNPQKDGSISFNVKISRKSGKNIVYTIFFLMLVFNSAALFALLKNDDNKQSSSVIDKEMIESRVEYNECLVGRNGKLDINHIRTDKNNCLQLEKGDIVTLQFLDDTAFNAQIECFVIEDDAPKDDSEAVFCVSNETLVRCGISDVDKRGLYKMKIHIKKKNQNEN